LLSHQKSCRRLSVWVGFHLCWPAQVRVLSPSPFRAYACAYILESCRLLVISFGLFCGVYSPSSRRSRNPRGCWSGSLVDFCGVAWLRWLQLGRVVWNSGSSLSSDRGLS
jgi:hypothetical protein